MPQPWAGKSMSVQLRCFRCIKSYHRMLDFTKTKSRGCSLIELKVNKAILLALFKVFLYHNTRVMFQPYKDRCVA